MRSVGLPVRYIESSSSTLRQSYPEHSMIATTNGDYLSDGAVRQVGSL